MKGTNRGTPDAAGKARSPLNAAIIFGSATSSPGTKLASVRATCEAVGLARSTYYYQSHRSTESIALEQRIVERLLELRDAHPTNGYRRMTDQLQLEGFKVNRKRIARLMQLHSLTAPAHSASNHGRHGRPPANASAPEPAQAAGPNQVWIADLAYVRIQSGLIYAAAVIDGWSREVVGYAASTHINPRLPALALHSAVRARRPALGCVHHCTFGLQYLMRGYQELLHQYGLIPTRGAADETPAIGGTIYAAPAPARQVVAMPAYASWIDVVGRADEFIRALYAQEKIDSILRSERNRNLSCVA